MEKFREIISRRLKILISISGLFTVIVLLIALYGDSVMKEENNFIHGFQSGIFIGVQIILLLKSKKLRGALKNYDTLKALYIEENDERKIMIKQKTGSIGLNIIMISVALSVVISGFYSITISFTLLITLVFIVLVEASLKYYFNKKY